MKSAKIAVRAMTLRMMMGTSATASTRMEVSRQGQVWGSVAARLAFIADPRVDDGVEHVHDQVDDDDHDSAQQHRGLDDGEIAEGDALVEEAPHPGPREDGFHDHGHVDHQNQVD